MNLTLKQVAAAVKQAPGARLRIVLRKRQGSLTPIFQVFEFVKADAFTKTGNWAAHLRGPLEIYLPEACKFEVHHVGAGK